MAFMFFTKRKNEYWKLRNWKLEIGNWKLEIGNWKLEIKKLGNWKLEIGPLNFQFPISTKTITMDNSKYVPLEELTIYQQAMEIGEIIWSIVDKWDYFTKKTTGAQLVDAADSVAANISEGYGRFHYKDKRNFYFYARGSLSETKTWSTKAKNRNKMDIATYEMVYEKLKSLHLALNSIIKKLPIN